MTSQRAIGIFVLFLLKKNKRREVPGLLNYLMLLQLGCFPFLVQTSYQSPAGQNLNYLNVFLFY